MSECRKGEKNRSECFPQWPNYPCWVQREKACYNTKGNEQLFDPLSDIFKPLSNILGSIHTAILTSMFSISEPQREQSRNLYFEFLNSWASTIVPISNPTLSSMELVRQYNTDEYLGYAEDYTKQLLNTIKNLRKGDNLQNAIQQAEPPSDQLQIRNETEMIREVGPGFGRNVAEGSKKKKQKKTLTKRKTKKGNKKHSKRKSKTIRKK